MTQTAANMDCVCLELRLKLRLQKWSCKGLCKNRSAKSHPNAQTICYYLLTWSLLLAAMGFFTSRLASLLGMLTVIPSIDAEIKHQICSLLAQ